MTSPVIAALVNAKVQDLIDPPRSWGASEKAAFLRLPPDLQRFYENREKQRDAEVRRCQNDRADALKNLAIAEDQLERAHVRIKALNAEVEQIRKPSAEAKDAA